MGNLKINYISDAQKDLDDIFDFITQNYFSETIARATVQKIVCGVKNLSEMPHLGISQDKKLGRKLNRNVGIRMLILERYLVFYFVKEEQIFIMRVLDAKQDYMRFLNQFSALTDSNE
jgi:addiction module RelE/StbE family toxin